VAAPVPPGATLSYTRERNPWDPVVWVNPVQPPLRVAMRSPLPFPCVPDRPYKILLAQVGTLSSSHPSFGLSIFFLSFFKAGHPC